MACIKLYVGVAAPMPFHSLATFRSRVSVSVSVKGPLVRITVY